MYKLIVNNKGVIIIDKTLSKDECESIKHNGAQWIVNAFKKHINIDISNYRLDEYVSGSGFFALHIRPEDLAKLREDKLSKLFGQ
jgi:DNA primase